MKKFVLFILLLASTSPSLLASHMAGGEIWYEFTGDANNPYKYRIWVQFYRDISGIAAPMNEQVSLKSYCFPDRCVNLTFAPFTLQNPCPGPNNNPNNDTCYGSVPGSILTPAIGECVNAGSGGNFVQTEIYRFYADVVLDGPCSDWRFAFNENARNANSNLATSGTFYIEATLNNLLGPNSGAVFTQAASRAFCVGQQFNWSHSAIDREKDSLYYELVTPLTSSDACPTTPSPMTFAAGYSQSQPMSTTNGLHLDPQTGIMTFTPSNTEVVSMSLVVTEYRYDTASGNRLRVGSMHRDIITPILSQCKPQAFQINLQLSQSLDSTMAEIGCNEKRIKLETDIILECSSIAPDGSDFALLNSQGNLVPIVAAGSDDCSGNLTRSIWLQLHDSIYYNDTMQLVSRTGIDGNTLINTCGFEMASGASMPVVVTTCSTGLGQKVFPLSSFSLYPNPAKETLHINSPVSLHNSSYQVLDAQGRVLIESEEMPADYVLDISQLPVGYYFLRIAQDQEVRNLRFQKL